MERISRNLERIADLATNIGEDVSYIVEGKVIKHGRYKEGDKIVIDVYKMEVDVEG